MVICVKQSHHRGLFFEHKLPQMTHKPLGRWPRAVAHRGKSNYHKYFSLFTCAVPSRVQQATSCLNSVSSRWQKKESATQASTSAATCSLWNPRNPRVKKHVKNPCGNQARPFPKSGSPVSKIRLTHFRSWARPFSHLERGVVYLVYLFHNSLRVE